MKIDSNTKILLILLLMSAMSIILHRAGAFNTYFNLLAKQHNFNYVTNSSDSAEAELDYSSEMLVMQCTIEDVAAYRHCGVSIKLHENPAVGMDLSVYQNILIDVDFLSPNESGPVRLLFRNFHPNYSKTEHSKSLKYNAIQFVPEKKILEKPIPTTSFQTASWWIDEYRIGYEDAQPDISNVSLVEIETASAKIPGDYSITIRKLVLQGYLFSEYTLIKGLLLLWLLVSIFMVSRQHRTLKIISNHDPLTKIMNRRGLNQWLGKYFASGQRQRNLAMFYIDIDDFKKVNDSYGHVVGDHLLCEFCNTIEDELSQISIRSITKNHILARLSGDEFSLVFYGINNVQIKEIANKLLNRFSKSVTVDGIEIDINASIGIATSTAEVVSPAVLMGNADAAMYQSKKAGKNQYKLFDHEVSENIIFRKKISAALRNAIENSHFNLLFMPIYHSDGFRMLGTEVLIRCSTPEFNDIGPDIFIPIAEEYGLIREIDLWVIESTFKSISQNAQLIGHQESLFCINISAQELVNRSFPDQLKGLMEKYRIDPTWIELELTETSLIDVDQHSISLLHELTKLGVTLSLDDFGTGYTAFNQLLNYPVSRLKIDRSFVSKLTDDNSGDSTMVDVILAIAKSYDLGVVAEGVETEYQHQYLCAHKCEYVQGYFISEPISWSEFLNLLDQQKNAGGVINASKPYL